LGDRDLRRKRPAPQRLQRLRTDGRVELGVAPEQEGEVAPADPQQLHLGAICTLGAHVRLPPAPPLSAPRAPAPRRAALRHPAGLRGQGTRRARSEEQQGEYSRVSGREKSRRGGGHAPCTFPGAAARSRRSTPPARAPAPQRRPQAPRAAPPARARNGGGLCAPRRPGAPPPAFGGLSGLRGSNLDAEKRARLLPRNAHGEAALGRHGACPVRQILPRGGEVGRPSRVKWCG